MILLTPGPCMTSETVRQAGAAPDLNHRDPEYLDLNREIRQRLLQVYAGTSSGWTPYLIGGSGTAAVEAMVTSCVHSGPVLIIENGYYSARIAEILEVHHIPHDRLDFDWREPIELDRVEHALRTKHYEAVLLTHHETTLGRLNPVEAIAALASSHGAVTLLDAMSSFGADPLAFENLAAVASSANKCLHGLPGVGFVLVNHNLREKIAAVPRRTYYLHLEMYGSENPPLTPPVPTMMAMRQALRENPGGQPQRHADYRNKLQRLRDGLRSLGFTFAVPEEESSVTLTSPTLPTAWSSERWFEAHYERGFVIYRVKPPLNETYFQVSVMGEVNPAHIDQWLQVVAAIQPG